MSDELASIQQRTFERARSSTSDSFPPDSRLSAAQLSRYLDRRVFAVVCTTRPDGRPHAAMSSYYRAGKVFWLPTVADSVRGRNVQATPWACLVVTEGDHDEHVMVSVEGVAELVEPTVVPNEVRDRVDGDWVDRWIRLTAERVLSYGAGGVRTSL